MGTGIFCGALLGFVLQRGKFCFTTGFRDVYLIQNTRILNALFVAIAIQAMGVYTLIQFDVLTYEAGTYSFVAVALGSFMFGMGMMITGGCAVGLGYRAAEGLVGSWIALLFYMMTSTFMQTSAFKSIQEPLHMMQVRENAMTHTFGVNQWVLIVFFIGVVALLIVREAQKYACAHSPKKRENTGLKYILFEKSWSMYATASFIGIIAILSWVLSAASGRMAGLAVTVPSTDLLKYIVTGDAQYINWGVYFVCGMWGGAFIAAKGSGEFRIRIPHVKTTISSIIGGVLMGIGANLAGGSTISNVLVQTALFSWQGWIALGFMMFGVWTVTYFVFVRSTIKKTSLASTTMN